MRSYLFYSSDMEKNTRPPTIERAIDAVSNVQLHRYNADTLELTQNSIKRWSAELSAPDAPIESYFIRFDFESISEKERRRFFNRIPTNYSLSQEQVDKLITAGHELLRANPEYQRFVKDLGGAM